MWSLKYNLVLFFIPFLHLTIKYYGNSTVVWVILFIEQIVWSKLTKFNKYTLVTVLIRRLLANVVITRQFPDIDSIKMMKYGGRTNRHSYALLTTVVLRTDTIVVALDGFLDSNNELTLYVSVRLVSSMFAIIK